MKFFIVVAVALAVFQAVFASNVALRLKQLPGSAVMVSSMPPANSLESSAAAISNYLQSASAAAQAQSQAALSAATSQSSIPATKLLGESSAAMLLNSESSASLAGSLSGSQGSGCISHAGCGSGSGNAGMSIGDAVRPIDEWMKDFKSRTAADGTDLMAAAKMTIQPLLQKLKRNQQAALEKLEDSNAQILQDVAEKAATHVYNLLRAQHIKDVNEQSAQAKREKIEEMKSEAAEREAQTKVLLEHSHSESSKH